MCLSTCTVSESDSFFFAWLNGSSPYRVLTCVIHVGPSVEGGGSTGLNLPLRASVLGCPTTEGWVTGPPEVAGKPQKSCRFVEERSRSHQRKSDFIIVLFM